MDTKLSLDHSVERFRDELTREQEAGRVNGLEALAESQRRRAVIDEQWKAIQQIVQPLQQAMKDLPTLPDLEQIRWAQSVLWMPNVAFLEIDTTGLKIEDDLVRFTLIDGQGKLLEDLLIKPVTRFLSREVSHFNGITAEHVNTHGLDLDTAWTRIKKAVLGKYLLSHGRDWDRNMLESVARRYHLEPLPLIGDDLQRHATRYYHQEYALSLAELCERVGSPLPAYPEQTALHRAHGQLAVLTGFSCAVTNVRTKQSLPSPIEETSTPDDLDDEHLF